MSPPSLSSETLHVSAVAIDGRAVLIGGRSGTGKSDLALRLIDRGAVLISDDYTFVHRVQGQALASAPATIAGKIEVRGVGIVERRVGRRRAGRLVRRPRRAARAPARRRGRGSPSPASRSRPSRSTATMPRRRSRSRRPCGCSDCRPDERDARHHVLRFLARRAAQRESGARHALPEEPALAGGSAAPDRPGRARRRLYRRRRRL